MPLQNTLRPLYFGCSTTPPRSTQISLIGSRIARSTAVSVSASVSSSSALRKRGFWMVTIAVLPLRSSLRRTEIDHAGPGKFAAVARSPPRFGRSIAWQRCMPFSASASTLREKDALIDLDAVLFRSASTRFRPRPACASASARARAWPRRSKAHRRAGSCSRFFVSLR